MKSQAPGQVALPELLFGMSWEDPESDRRALRIQPGDTVFTITSGGCNTLSLLLDDPREIYSLDINSCQSHLLALKCAAIRRWEHGDLWTFLGLKPSQDRLAMFESLAADLPRPALEYWRSRPEAIRDGVVYQGRYEAFLRQFRRVLGLVQGRRRIKGLFECRSLQEQRDYFDRVWNTPQWRLLFRLAFNKRVLARRGLVTDYFRFDDGSSSFEESFFNRSKKAFRDIPIASNYFLAQYLTGSYVSPDAAPAYLRKENLPGIRERLDRIRIVTADAKTWLASQPEGLVDAFSLSNICELMGLDETALTFEQLARTARAGARICFRNLMIPRDVPSALSSRIQLQQDCSRLLLEQDRSFVYSRVQAYVVVP
jgi:S-adenosylmethionine-diacylglycerol 3-amino-3-carboxypropyl transferase